jgi:deoxyribonuclease V
MPIKIQAAHPWKVSLEQAKIIQLSLAQKVITDDKLKSELRYVAGIDVGFEDKKTTRAAVVVLNFPDLTIHETVLGYTPIMLPYIPGYLSFREIPAIIKALEQLKTVPDLILCDGQGIAHPRRLGIASHLGVLTDLPTIGVAKSKYIGNYLEPTQEKGNWTPLNSDTDVIGGVLRTRANVKPLFISTGHRVSLDTAIALTMQCVTRYRLPEPTRLADKLAAGKLNI